MDKKLHNRFNRLEGQLQRLHQKIEDGTDCSEVIPQFLAVKGALAGAFELYVKESIDSCANTDKERLQKLIAQLVRA